jgi:hypothetical protein
MLIESADGSQTFAPPRELAATSGASDYPFLKSPLILGRLDL